MDWPAAAVVIAAIAAWLIDRAHERKNPETDTEAIGFHVGHIGGKDDDD